MNHGNEPEYCIAEHIHRFGKWAAARAASKSLLSNSEVEAIIKDSALKNEVEQLRLKSTLTIEEYNEWHIAQCDEIRRAFDRLPIKQGKTKRMKYGIAAKIIAIYIKTVEVIPTGGTSRLSNVAHPPIDSILLRNINDKTGKKLDIHWSKFERDQYFQTLEEIKDLTNEKPFWHLETYWK